MAADPLTAGLDAAGSIAGAVEAWAPSEALRRSARRVRLSTRIAAAERRLAALTRREARAREGTRRDDRLEDLARIAAGEVYRLRDELDTLRGVS